MCSNNVNDSYVFVCQAALNLLHSKYWLLLGTVVEFKSYCYLLGTGRVSEREEEEEDWYL